MDTPQAVAMTAVIDDLVKRLIKESPMRTEEPLSQSQADRGAIQAAINDIVKPFMLIEMAMRVKEPVSRLVRVMMESSEESREEHHITEEMTAIIRDFWKPLTEMIIHATRSSDGLLEMVKRIEEFTDQHSFLEVCMVVENIMQLLLELLEMISWLEMISCVPVNGKDLLSRMVLAYINEHILKICKEEEISAAVNDIVKPLIDSVKSIEESLNNISKKGSFDHINDMFKSLTERVSRIKESLEKSSKEESSTARTQDKST